MATRLRVFSDLHTEFAPFHLPRVEADLVVLAGDIGKGVRGVEWAQKMFPDVPVVYVAGNHEYYGGAMPRTLEKMQAAAAGTNVQVLERAEVRVGPVRILATTLWTDFALFGEDRAWASGEVAAAAMNDYQKIRTSPRYRRLRPVDTRREHALAKAWLKERLEEETEAESTVVVTHHAPSARSLDPRFAKDRLSPAYASRLDEMVAGSGAELWVHGHTHHCVDYRVGGTRVVSNQRGYPDEPVGGFDSGGVVEVGGGGA
ncbi:MAG: metallophosphoesterase [Myxococcota bacterium]